MLFLGIIKCHCCLFVCLLSCWNFAIFCYQIQIGAKNAILIKSSISLQKAVPKSHPIWIKTLQTTQSCLLGLFIIFLCIIIDVALHAEHRITSHQIAQIVCMCGRASYMYIQSFVVLLSFNYFFLSLPIHPIFLIQNFYYTHTNYLGCYHYYHHYIYLLCLLFCSYIFAFLI